MKTVNGINVVETAGKYTYNGCIMGRNTEKTQNIWGYQNETTVGEAVRAGLNVYIDDSTGTPILEKDIPRVDLLRMLEENNDYAFAGKDTEEAIRLFTLVDHEI